MSTETFINHRFNAGSLAIIEQANEILREYESQGLILTLRQVYYQFVARGALQNKQSEYKRLGGILSDARLAGLIDWDMMEDRTRSVRRTNTWANPESIVNAVAAQYKEDLWRGQPYRPEVWIEKDALVGVIERACNDYQVPYFACRGYASQSAQYASAQRFRRYRNDKQTPLIFHFGDHDPSGIDMTRENGDKIALLARQRVEVRRLALNMDQIEQYNPPPNPAKESDSRFGEYTSRFGDQSWELDALEPRVIDELIRSNVRRLIDDRRWERAVEAQDRNKDLLARVSSRWDEVAEFVS